MSTPYLDFQNEQQSLSFESFHEGDNQVIELAAFRQGMCIRYNVLTRSQLRVSFNGESKIETTLAPGQGCFNLEQDVIGGDGVLTFVVIDEDSFYSRSYKLVSDYVLAYSEYMFKIYAGEREAQRLERLRYQCPQPQGEETLDSLARGKYDAAAQNMDALHRLLGALSPIDASNMFHVANSLGDSAAVRQMIDRALQNLSDRLHDAQRLLAETQMAVEHSRYYRDQHVAGRN